MRDPFRYLNNSPAVIRFVVIMYIRCASSLTQVEDFLFERGIDNAGYRRYRKTRDGPHVDSDDGRIADAAWPNPRPGGPPYPRNYSAKTVRSAANILIQHYS